MKKRSVTFCRILILLICFLTVTAAQALAETSSNSIPVTGASSKVNGTSILCGKVYESVGKTKEDKSFTSYYSFTAPSDDICTISFESNGYWYNNNRTSWLIVAYDSNGSQVAYKENHYTVNSDSFKLMSFPKVVCRLSFSVEKGQRYYFLLANGGARRSDGGYYDTEGLAAYRDPNGNYRFSVCLKGNHAAVYPYTYETEKEPTCTENGIETAVCEWCGATLDKRSLPATGHTAGEWQMDQVATCGEDGFRSVRCTVCNEILEKEILQRKQHTQGAYVTIKEPSCEDPGWEKSICEICGETVSERPIAPLGHDGTWQVSAEATCGHTGLRIEVCSRCNVTIRQETIEKLPHTLPDEWVLYRPATCVEEGLEIRRCEQCGEYADSRTIPALGHTPGKYETIQEASCVHGGRRRQLCDVCNAEIGVEILDPYGHSFTDWIITTLPTAETEGMATRFCQICGEVENKTLKKTE